MRRTMAVLVVIAGCGAAQEPWQPPREPSASEQGRVPAVITTQEWSGGANRFCFDGTTSSGMLGFTLTPDACIPATYPRPQLRCAATVDEQQGVLRFEATYSFGEPPPYRPPMDACSYDDALPCSIAAPAPGNYVVVLGDLQLPVTVGKGSRGNICTQRGEP